MGLERQLQSKYDGSTVQAFYVIDLISLNLFENKGQVYGRVFASDAAFTAGRTPLDNFSVIFYDLKQLMAKLPSEIESNAYAWLKDQPEFVGAVEKDAPPPPRVPGEPPGPPPRNS